MDQMAVNLLCAIFGGFSVNFLRLVELANIPKTERPDFKDPLYLLQFFILPLLGAGLVYVYMASGNNLTPLISLNIGVSAPLILKSLAAAAPASVGKVD